MTLQLPVPLQAPKTVESSLLGVLRERLRVDGIVPLSDVDPKVEAFEELTAALGETFVFHDSDLRDTLGKDGTTQSVTYGKDFIPLHAERAYFPNRPMTLYFMCIKPPKGGGETLVCDGAKILDGLPSSLATFVRENRIRYDFVARPARWQRTLQTTDKQVATERLEALRMGLGNEESLTYGFSGDVFSYSYVTPLAGTTRFGDRRAFANSFFYLAPLHDPALWGAYFAGKLDERSAVLENGQPFPRTVAEGIYQVARELTVPIRWKTGDLIIIDNTRFLHGRNSFDDPERKILVRMSTEGVRL